LDYLSISAEYIPDAYIRLSCSFSNQWNEDLTLYSLETMKVFEKELVGRFHHPFLPTENMIISSIAVEQAS
jgi:hypothetical protein